MANKSTNLKITLKITSFILRLLMNITFYILIVILIINLSKAAFNFAYQLYGPVTVEPKGKGTRILLQIKEGESTMDVASKLELVHAIKDKYAFYLKAKLEKAVIMPGTYELSTDMTYNEILDIITDYSASIIKNPEATTDDKSKP